MVYSLSFSEGFWSEETRVMHWKQNGRYPVSSVVSTVIKETSTRVQFSTEQVFASSFLEQTVGKWERYCINLMAPECDIRIDFDTNEYPNIFVSRKRYERISEYIRIKRHDTNMIRMNIRIENDTNIRIFKYSSHSNRV